MTRVSHFAAHNPTVANVAHSISFASRTDDTPWPEPWKRRDRWPKQEHHDTELSWSEHPGVAVTVCIRPWPMEILHWDGLVEAAEAARELFDQPCGPTCIARHAVLWIDSDGPHLRGIETPTPTPSLAAELRAAGYHRPASAGIPGHGGGSLPTKYWPRPSIYNEPLGGSRTCPPLISPTTT